MADTTGVLDELGSRRPRRTQPPPRPITGTPREGALTVTQPAPDPVSAAPKAAPDSAPESVSAPAPAQPRIAPAPSAPPARLAPQAAVAPAPEEARERTVNVHGRLPESLFHRLDNFVREVERGGWGQTSKIEMIQLLVSELPDIPDEEFGQRLRAFRRAHAR